MRYAGWPGSAGLTSRVNSGSDDPQALTMDDARLLLGEWQQRPRVVRRPAPAARPAVEDDGDSVLAEEAWTVMSIGIAFGVGVVVGVLLTVVVVAVLISYLGTQANRSPRDDDK